MARYKVIRDGRIENIVEWDGVSQWQAPSGATLELALEAEGIEPAPALTDDQILAARPRRQRLTPTAAAGREAIEEYAAELFADWQRWKLTHAEAQARGLAAGLVSALSTKTDAAWATYAQTLNAWRTAV